MTTEAKRPLVVIGTSGSTDYLMDSTGGRRFWPVTVASDDGEGCDGLHDEEAPAAYLCTRCFPDLGRGDLGRGHDDDEDDNRDEPPETE